MKTKTMVPEEFIANLFSTAEDFMSKAQRDRNPLSSGPAARAEAILQYACAADDLYRAHDWDNLDSTAYGFAVQLITPAWRKLRHCPCCSAHAQAQLCTTGPDRGKWACGLCNFRSSD